MTNTLLDRAGAISGVVFTIGLFLAAGDGSHAYDPARAAAGMWSIALAVPFVAYVSSVLDRGDRNDAWLTRVAVTSGTAGIVVKMISEVPELGAHRAGVGDTGQMHEVLDAMSGGATVICLASLAIFCTAVAVSALRTSSLPRWLGIGAAVTAICLAVNSVFLSADFVPAFLLFMLWCLCTGVHLLWATRRNRVGAAHHTAAPAHSPN